MNTAEDSSAGDSPPDILLHDLTPAVAKMRADVLAGLRSDPKFLPSQYLYDHEGARLFEAICEQPEYYVTRTELEIMRANMESIAAAIGPDALLVEPGSGEGAKSILLLEGLLEPAGFVPIDISREQLVDLAESVAARFPDLEVHPVCADFTGDLELPPFHHPVGRRVAFLPGSTIGNFVSELAEQVLRDLRSICGDRGRVLIGVDLKKSSSILEPAYDDAAGVSRDFALNYLRRLNRELHADFDLDSFAYEAPYDAEQGVVTMALISRRDQTATIGDEKIRFARDERVRTEHSFKFDLKQFRDIARRAGLSVERVWTDPDHLFSVQLLAPV